MLSCCCYFFFFSSRRRHTSCGRDWSSDVCSSDLVVALLAHDYAGKTRVVRVNGVTTSWCLGDIIEVVSGAGDSLDCIMIPKVEDASQLHFVDHLLTQLEAQHGIGHRIGIEAQIEN